MSPTSLSYDPPAPSPSFHAVVRKDCALAACVVAMTFFSATEPFWVCTRETEDGHMVITVWDHDPGIEAAVDGCYLADPEEQADWLMDVNRPNLRSMARDA